MTAAAVTWCESVFVQVCAGTVKRRAACSDDLRGLEGLSGASVRGTIPADYLFICLTRVLVPESWISPPHRANLTLGPGSTSEFPLWAGQEKCLSGKSHGPAAKDAIVKTGTKQKTLFHHCMFHFCTGREGAGVRWGWIPPGAAAPSSSPTCWAASPGSCSTSPFLSHTSSSPPWRGVAAEFLTHSEKNGRTGLRRVQIKKLHRRHYIKGHKGRGR